MPAIEVTENQKWLLSRCITERLVHYNDDLYRAQHFDKNPKYGYIQTLQQKVDELITLMRLVEQAK